MLAATQRLQCIVMVGLSGCYLGVVVGSQGLYDTYWVCVAQSYAQVALCRAFFFPWLVLSAFPSSLMNWNVGNDAAWWFL